MMNVNLGKNAFESVKISRRKSWEKCNKTAFNEPCLNKECSSLLFSLLRNNSVITPVEIDRITDLIITGKFAFCEQHDKSASIYNSLISAVVANNNTNTRSLRKLFDEVRIKKKMYEKPFTLDLP